MGHHECLDYKETLRSKTTSSTASMYLQERCPCYEMLIAGHMAWKGVEIAQKTAPCCPRGVSASWKVGKEIHVSRTGCSSNKTTTTMFLVTAFSHLLSYLRRTKEKRKKLDSRSHLARVKARSFLPWAAASGLLHSRSGYLPVAQGLPHFTKA